MGKPVWKRIDVERNILLAQSQDATHKGVSFHLFISPYHLPHSIEGCFDKAHNRFVIKFLYPMSEPAKEHKLDEYVVISLGKKSGRIFKIEVDVVALQAESVVLTISTALAKLKGTDLYNDIPRSNFQVTETLINQKQNALLGTMTQNVNHP